MSRHADRSIIVTGAAGAIGFATCEILAREGAKLLMVDINAARLTERADALRAKGARVVALRCRTAARRLDVKRYAQAAIDAFGRIDGFFNNAGVEGKLAPTHEYDVRGVRSPDAREHARRVPRACVTCCPTWCERGSGSVVNMASIGSERGLPAPAPTTPPSMRSSASRARPRAKWRRRAFA